MAPLTNAAKMIQEAEESGKSLLEVSFRDSFLLSTKTKWAFQHSSAVHISSIEQTTCFK